MLWHIKNIPYRCYSRTSAKRLTMILIYVSPPSVRCNTPLSSPRSSTGFGELKSDTESETSLSRQRISSSRRPKAAFNSAASCIYHPGSRAHVQRTLLTLLRDDPPSPASLVSLQPRVCPPGARGVNSRSRTPTHEGKITVAGSLDTTRSHTIRPFPPDAAPRCQCVTTLTDTDGSLCWGCTIAPWLIIYTVRAGYLIIHLQLESGSPAHLLFALLSRSFSLFLSSAVVVSLSSYLSPPCLPWK